ncbi:Endonuclease/exonuclease/phosphatase [Myxozyma melibiosi]|uniref:Endonuclease/exonuclease/phosphatase n=1 Tax=Myxozyma melibiosi TaxID=54550 RepID=A0ABR1FAD9_9ASCO
MSNSDPSTMAKKESALKKSGGKPDFVTPEYIAAQRAKREQAKLEKARKNKELGIVPQEEQVAANTSFIKRPMLAVNDGHALDAASEGVDVKIMTYNVLGQALIRRKLFPTNGDILKWKLRSKVLLSELKFYDADVMCMQEVDLAHLEGFYYPELTKLGFDYLFHRGERKNHGLLICWKKALFSLVKSEVVDYDNDCGYDDREAEGAVVTEPQMLTRNIALLAALKFNSSEKGIVIGTTHLFWHPHGTLERTRQCAIFVRNAKTFANNLDVAKTWPVFLAGDFNSLPFDAPYLCLTKASAERVTERSKYVITNSAIHEYKKKAVAEEADDDAEDEEQEDVPEESENKPAEPAPVQAQAPAAPVMMEEFLPETSHPPIPIPSADSAARIAGIEDVYRLHDNNEVRLRSVYGECYRYVHPENANIESRNGEPTFSNWAHTWRGLLDYIFAFDFPERRRDDVQMRAEEGDVVPGVKALELLRLPLPAEMGEEPCGQPRVGQYPSDHLCLMAKLRIY